MNADFRRSSKGRLFQISIFLRKSAAAYVFVEDIALLGGEACLADQELKHLLVGAVVGPGRCYDILLDHNRTHVVCSETQRNLSEPQTLCQPGRLEVFDVVEKQTGDCKHLQVIDTCRLVFNPASKRRVLTLEGPGDERGEAASFIL